MNKFGVVPCQLEKNLISLYALITIEPDRPPEPLFTPYINIFIFVLLSAPSVPPNAKFIIPVEVVLVGILTLADDTADAVIPLQLPHPPCSLYRLAGSRRCRLNCREA